MGHQRLDVSPTRKQALDALSRLSQKWHPVVLAVLAERGETGFNELLDAIPDVSGKVLSETLDELGDDGFIDRAVLSESPLRVEYSLTEAGQDLEPVFDALASWSDDHLDSFVPTILIAEKDRRMTEMYQNWLADQYKIIRAHNSEQVDETVRDDIDIVLFSRRMPGVDASRVPSVAPTACRTVLLVDERPGFDLLDIDCDDVLFKPLVRETALDAIDRQLTRQGESERKRTYHALRAKRDALEHVYERDELSTNERYETLCERIDKLEEEITEQ